MLYLPELKALGFFNSIDFHFAHFINKQSENPCDELYLAALLCSYFTNAKHTAFDLTAYAGVTLKSLIAQNAELDETICVPEIKLPTIDDWCHLLTSQTVVVGDESERKPLVLSDSKLLYLHRYFNYEKIVAKAIKVRTKAINLDLDKVKRSLGQLFPKSTNQVIDWQEVAAFSAVRSNFCVISGGPGTGKTTTVAKVLALLLDSNPDLEVSLVAPTGKAADRLGKSIQGVKERLNFDSRIVDLIPEEATTIHRFLGYIPNSSNFRFNAENKKSTQLLLVDEASMVSLPLFAKLFMALEENCRVILLGDKDQLSAVETGNVLGDISDAEHINRFSADFIEDYSQMSSSSQQPSKLSVVASASSLENAVVKLMHSYRFGSESGIGYLSAAVNNSDSEKALLLLDDETFSDVTHRTLPTPDRLKKELSELVKNGGDGVAGYGSYRQAVKSGDPRMMLEAFDKFQVLCTVHRGPYGDININEQIEKLLFPMNKELNYIGKPVMITENDRSRGLSNGDVGIMANNESGELCVFFTDGQELRQFSPTLLPAHTLAFAMTVHKSQGSEYADVLMILPDQHNNLLTKEIIYTGITRAKQNVAIWATKSTLKQGAETKTTRASGLKLRLTN